MPEPSTAREPVTVIITRRIRRGHEAEYEALLLQLQQEARQLPGYLGVTTQRPPPGGPPEYVSVVRWDSVEALRGFEHSSLRARFLERVQRVSEADAVWQEMTGLEFWFTPPPGTVVPQPSKARMALLLIGTVYTLVLLVGTLLGEVLVHLPFEVPMALKLLATITIQVLLMTWFVMPWLTRRLAAWIYPRRAAAAD